MKALMLLCSLVTVMPAATLKTKGVGIPRSAYLGIWAGITDDDDDDDVGKEVLAQRELAGKNLDAMLTAGN